MTTEPSSHPPKLRVVEQTPTEARRADLRVRIDVLSSKPGPISVPDRDRIAKLRKQLGLDEA